MPRIIHLLDSTGHMTIGWEPQNDDKLLPAIDHMLASGYKFFIVRDNSATGAQDEVEITNSQETIATRRLKISDEVLQQLYDAGIISIGGISLTEDEDATTGEVATDAETVVQNETVATQPKSGG